MEQTPIRIFIVSNEQGLIERLLSAILTEDDLVIAGLAQDLENAIGLAQQAAPDIVLVGEPLEGAEDRLRRLAIQAPLATVIAVCPREDPDCARRALLAGARAFVLDPLDKNELCTVIREVHAIEVERRAKLSQVSATTGPQAQSGAAPSYTAASRGTLLGVVSPKNGTGRSVIAVNLALLLRQQTKKEVLLMDARHTLGDLDTMMNLVPTATLADLGSDVSDVDEHLLRSVLLKHASGVWVLLSPQWPMTGHQWPDPSPPGRPYGRPGGASLLPAAPPSPRMWGERGGLPDADGLGRILELVRGLFDYVIVDCGPLTDPYTSVVLQQADRLLLVVVPEMPALQRTALFLEAARRSGFPLERIHVVLNRSTARGGIAHPQIEERLGVEIPFTIPEDIPLTTYSINQGVPLVQSYPKSAVALSLSQMAQRLIGWNGPSAVAFARGSGQTPRAAAWLNRLGEFLHPYG